MAGRPKTHRARVGGGTAPANGKRRQPHAAIVGGGASLASEALGLMLVESGTPLAGIYPDPRALRCELDARVVDVQVAMVDGDDPRCTNRAVVELGRAHPSLKIMLLCDQLTPATVQCAIDAGLEGVVLKSDSTEDLISALGHIFEGRSVMPADWQTVAVETDPDPLDALSTREREVLDLAAAGLRNREIAERLMISSNTVKFHLRSIYAQLGVRNRVQAMRAVQDTETG